jgi:hypothetical protein
VKSLSELVWTDRLADSTGNFTAAPTPTWCTMEGDCVRIDVRAHGWRGECTRDAHSVRVALSAEESSWVTALPMARVTTTIGWAGRAAATSGGLMFRSRWSFHTVISFRKMRAMVSASSTSVSPALASSGML